MKRLGVLSLALSAVMGLFMGCQSISYEQDASFMSGDWILAAFGQIKEDSLPNLPKATLTVTVSEDKKSASMSFRGPLNTYEGRYTIGNKQALSVDGDFVATAVSGSDEDMQMDDRMKAAITSLNGWFVGEHEGVPALVLASESTNDEFVFVKADDAAPEAAEETETTETPEAESETSAE